MLNQLILVATWSKAWTATSHMLGLQVEIPPEHECLPVVDAVCCTGRRGLCDGPIPRPEESY